MTEPSDSKHRIETSLSLPQRYHYNRQNPVPARIGLRLRNILLLFQRSMTEPSTSKNRIETRSFQLQPQSFLQTEPSTSKNRIETPRKDLLLYASLWDRTQYQDRKSTRLNSSHLAISYA